MVWEPGLQAQMDATREYAVSRARQQSYTAQATPDLAANVAAISRAHPQIDAKIVGAAAFAGMTADDPALMELSARSISKKGGGFMSSLGDMVSPAYRMVKKVASPIAGVAKPAIRGAFGVVETPFQFVGANLRNLATSVSGKADQILAGALAGGAAAGAGGALFGGVTALPAALAGAVVGGVGGALAPEVEGKPQNPFAQTTAGQVVSARLAGRDVDMGSGYFTSGDIHKRTVERQRAAGSINGHAMTGGRLIADGYTRPGTTSYNLMSGLVDFALVTKFDPTFLGAKELKVFRAGRRTILPGEASPTANLARKLTRQSGNIRANALVNDSEEAIKFLGSDEVMRVMDDLALDGSPTSIGKKLRGKSSPELNNRIADAKTSAEVRDALMDVIMNRTLREKKALESGKGIMSTVRTNRTASRLAGWTDAKTERTRTLIPYGGVDLIDFNQMKLAHGITHLDNYLTNIGFGAAERAVISDGFSRVKNHAEGKRFIEGVMTKEVATKLASKGWDNATVNKALGEYGKVREDLASKLREEIIDDARLPGLVVGDELFPVANGTAVLERLEYVTDLPDPEWLRRVASAQTDVDALEAVAKTRPLSADEAGVLNKARHTVSEEVAAQKGDIINLPDVRELRRLTTPTWAINPKQARRTAAANKKIDALDAIKKTRPLTADETSAYDMAKRALAESEAKERKFLSRKALYNSQGWKQSVGLMDKYMGTVWRPLTLLRPAWTVRIILEEQARMMAMGMEVPITHPFQIIVGMVTGKGEYGAFRPGAGLKATPLGMSSEANLVMATNHTARIGGNHMGALSKFRKLYQSTDEGFGGAWTGKLVAANNDEVMRRIATYGVQDTVAWFTSPEAKGARELVESVMGRPMAGGGAEHHVYSAYEDLRILSADDPEILYAVAHGVLPKGSKLGTQATAQSVGTHTSPIAGRGATWEGGPEFRGGVGPRGGKIREVGTGEQGQFFGLNTVALEDGFKISGKPFRSKTGEWIVQAKKGRNSKRYTFETEGEARAFAGEAKKPGKNTYDKGAPHEVTEEGIPHTTRTSDEMFLRGERTTVEGFEEGIPLAALDGSGMNADAVRELSRRGFDPRIKTPQEILGNTPISVKHKQIWDRTTEYMFNHLLSMPTDYLSRQPAFKQIYWKHMADNAAGMTAEAQATMLAKARVAVKSLTGKDVPLYRKTMARLQRAVDEGKAGRVGKMDFDDMDELAKAAGVERVKLIFDDMTRKGAMGDAMRHVAPFGNAWRQATTQWARIFVEDPLMIRKVQLGATSPRGAFPDKDGKGFFYKDDQGEWVFNYPGSGIVSQYGPKFVPGGRGGILGMGPGAEGGVPFKMQGKVAGVSMLSSSVLPGFGPMVSLAASKVLEDKPEYDDLRNLLAPYGDPTQEGVLEQALPPWFKKVEQAFSDPDTDRLQGDTMGDVMQYLVSTGKFNTDTPEAQEELLEAAKARARSLTLVRMMTQAFGPSAPRVVPMAQDKNGDTVVAQKLAKRLHELQDEDYETSTQKFLEEFGDQAIMFLQANTRPRNPGVVNLNSDKGFDFARSNPELVTLLPNTYGFFAPESTDEKTINYSAYLRLLKTGERETLTTREKMALANDKVASMRFYNIKDALGPKITDEQQAILKELKAELKRQYPGFETAKIGLQTRPETPALIDEITKAVQIEKVQATPVGAATARYLRLRDAAMRIAESRGLTQFQDNNAMADVRAILREAAALLAAETPGFNLIFDRVFDAEMRGVEAE